MPIPSVREASPPRVLTLSAGRQLPLSCCMDQTIAIEQLVPGRLAATDAAAALGSVLMTRISSSLPGVIRVRGLPGWASYVLPEAAHSIYCSGIRCGPEHCLVIGSGADLELICRAPAEVIVCRIGASPSAPTHFQRETYRLAGSAAELSRIRAMLSPLHGRLDECATMSHAMLLHKATYADLRDSLAELSVASQTSESLSGSHRAMSIERGRRYIHANLAGALRIASVCAAAGVRPRTLEYGFQELFGISPVSYIKAMRLNQVRRLLLTPTSAGRTITVIALDSGFWHLSQFAADYQKFFGESPSITRRALAQEPTLLREARSVSGFSSRQHGEPRNDQSCGSTTEWIMSTSVSQSNGLQRHAAAPSARHCS